VSAVAAEVPERPFARLLPALILFAFVVALGQQALAQFSLVQDSAKAVMHLTDEQLGLIQALGAAVPMLLLSIPIGILVDRTNRLRLTIILASVWTIGTIGTAFAGDMTTLILARMAAGVGATGAVTALISIAADLCAPAQRGRAMLILTVGKSAGIAAAIGVGGLVLKLLGPGGLWGLPSWRALLVLLGLASAAIVVLLFTQREPVRREVLAGPGAPFGEVFRELWARRGFLIPLFVGQIGVTMADASAGTFVAPILSRNYGIPPEAASWVGGVLFLTGLAGSIAGGVLADFGHRSGKRGGILYGAIIAAAIGIPGAFFSIAPSVNMLGAGLGLLMFCGTITGLITAVAITVLLPNELRGLCIGAFLSLAGLIGFGLAPWLVTHMSVPLGGEKHLGEALAILSVAVSIASVFAFLIAARRAPHSAVEAPI
jgi:MFS family permease